MKSIPLTKGRVAFVDEEDFDWLNQWKWTYLNSGYAFRQTPRPARKTLLMHRVILGAEEGQEIDHINGNKLDNRRENLRFCTSSQNKMNQKLRADNSTGIRGISYDRRDRAWHVYINKDGKRINRNFKSFEDAVQFRKDIETELFGSFLKQC